jgi:hypothetical protein
MRRGLAVCSLLALTLLAGSGAAAAQCAMCGLAAEQAGDPAIVARAFGMAVLVLLVPVNLLVAAVAWFTWRARDWDGAVFGPHPRTPDQSR